MRRWRRAAPRQCGGRCPALCSKRSQPRDGVRTRPRGGVAPGGNLPAGTCRNTPWARHMGSGALPLEKIPSIAIRILPVNMSVSNLAKKLRLNNPAILGYIEKDHFYLNLRTVRNDELPIIINAFTRIFS